MSQSELTTILDCSRTGSVKKYADLQYSGEKTSYFRINDLPSVTLDKIICKSQFTDFDAVILEALTNTDSGKSCLHIL